MNIKRQSRHNARRCAVQALYQWLFNTTAADDLIEQFSKRDDCHNTDVNYFANLVAGTIEHVVIIDELLTAHLDRSIATLNPIELSVLRVAIYELLHCAEVPYKVIINEALEITKEFGAVQGYKYVNAVLDAAVSRIRCDLARRRDV